MKIFISWSGETSKQIAEALKFWLSKVLQYSEPWVSSADIEKGARWSIDVGKNLFETDFGILCVTPENINAPWVLFEAGALSKSLDFSKVCPLLFNLEPTDIEGPLVQFQSTQFTKTEIYKLIESINISSKKLRLDESILKETFDVWWPDLENKIKQINPPQKTSMNERSSKDFLKEILTIVRQIHNTDSEMQYQQLNKKLDILALNAKHSKRPKSLHIEKEKIMICSKCGSKMTWDFMGSSEGLDGYEDDYAWNCTSCDHVIWSDGPE